MGRLHKHQIIKALTAYQIVENTNYYSIKGRLKNLWIRITESRISIKGSIPKFVNGNNLEPLTSEKIDAFLDTLHSIFGIAPTQWKITRLDIAVDIALKEPVQLYLPLFGSAKYKTIGYFNDTIYYKTSKKEICIYDKIKEIKKDRYNSIPIEYNHKNLMRIEFRILKSITRTLKLTHDATLDLLNKKSFTSKCIEYCIKEFEAIQFASFDLDLQKIKTPKHFEDFLQLQGVKHIGTVKINQIIHALRKANVFKHKSDYSRLKRRINLRLKRNSNSNETLINELKDEFKRLVKKGL